MKKISLKAQLSTILVGCVLFSGTSLAQDGTWDKSLNFGFNLTDGNSDTVLFTAGANASADYGDDLFDFEVAVKYGEARNLDTGVKAETQNDVRARGDYKHLISDRWYLGTGADFLHDNIADVNYRVKAKTALGYFLIKDEDLRFNVEAGPGYVFERVASISNDYFAPFISERLEWDITETSKFYEAATVTFDVDESDNTLVEAEAGLEAALSTNLSLIVAVKDIYDNLPAEGRQRNDLSIITALKVAL